MNSQSFELLFELRLSAFLSQVPEMRAEYYPPKVDIVIQNEISTDFYIIVSGAVVQKINPIQ